MKKKNPTLTLLAGGRAIDADKLAQFYARLTGREPSQQQIERARSKLLATGKRRPKSQ